MTHDRGSLKRDEPGLFGERQGHIVAQVSLADPRNTYRPFLTCIRAGRHQNGEVGVRVSGRRDDGTTVIEGVIRLWVTPRKRAAEAVGA